ncbi:MAG: hypothetical protein RLZZ49_263 [Bacteroidota bacterium]|jgi:hypothetical protein
MISFSIADMDGYDCIYFNILIDLFNASMSTSISSMVLYAAKDTLVVPTIPRQLINGCAQ